MPTVSGDGYERQNLHPGVHPLPGSPLRALRGLDMWTPLSLGILGVWFSRVSPKALEAWPVGAVGS